MKRLFKISIWGNYGYLIVNEEFGEFERIFSITPN